MNLPRKKSSSSKGAAQQGAQHHQIRIIGGIWKRSTISVVSGEGLRPTPDRVRETVFNWLQHLNHGQWASTYCLDLFAGSGALGFEAASRGAAQVLMVEAYAPAFAQLLQVKQKLKADQVDLKRGDALMHAQQWIAQGQRFDLIFLDPPFQQGYLEKILPLCQSLLTEQGMVYVESGLALPILNQAVQNELPAWCQGWECVRHDKAGQVFFHLLQRNKNQG